MDTSLDRNLRERPTIQTGKAKVTGFHVKDTPDRPGGQLSKELTKAFIQSGRLLWVRGPVLPTDSPPPSPSWTKHLLTVNQVKFLPRFYYSALSDWAEEIALGCSWRGGGCSCEGFTAQCYQTGQRLP